MFNMSAEEAKKARSPRDEARSQRAKAAWDRMTPAEKKEHTEKTTAGLRRYWASLTAAERRERSQAFIESCLSPEARARSMQTSSKRMAGLWANGPAFRERMEKLSSDMMKQHWADVRAGLVKRKPMGPIHCGLCGEAGHARHRCPKKKASD
jgi:hypothetical protein